MVFYILYVIKLTFLCYGILLSIVKQIMWMSSGGTSSVIHTDSVDNIICVLDGEKTLVLVDPDKYRSNVSSDIFKDPPSWKTTPPAPNFFCFFNVLQCNFAFRACFHPPNIFLYPPNFKFLEITLNISIVYLYIYICKIMTSPSSLITVCKS